MRTFAKIGMVSLLALCLTTTAWAGGSSCTKDSEASATKAKSATAGGSHCGAKTSTAAEQACGVNANQVMYSFTVSSVECEKCVETIQKAAMEKKGITCAHVDLATHTAYIIADKNLSQKDVSKVIATAGYKNKYVGQGDKVEAAFAKAMASGDKGINCCAKANKDKV